MTPTEEKALQIIHVLERAGFEARFVGGCVRDAVMGRPVGEVDLATTATPGEMMAVFAKARIRVVPTGIEHGTLTAIVEKTGIEITTLREDIETDGRHAMVTFTKDWAKDAARRDFTMNALSRDSAGKIHDTVGGWQDAQDGYVRFVGQASERIKEDYLRVLRFFRFLATHGRQLPDTAALKACHDAAPHLKELSRERVWNELKKMLSASHPCAAWAMMSEAGVAQKILPQAHAGRLERLEEIETAFPRFARDPVLRLAVLVHGEKTEAEMMQQRFALSNREAKNLSLFLDFSPPNEAPFSAKKTGLLAYRYGLDETGKFLLLAGVLGVQFDWESARAVLQTWQPKSFPLKGDDVVAQGIHPGPQVGAMLREIETWWIENDFTPDRESCMQKLKIRAQRGA